MDLLDLSLLRAIPDQAKDVLMIGVPFLIITLGTAAAMFLARDYLGKPSHNRRNGNGNGRNGRNGNGRTYRNENGSGNGNGHTASRRDPRAIAVTPACSI